MITARTLSQLGLFMGLPDEQLEAIAGLCEEVICQEGEFLFKEGERAERMYILLEGKVKIQVRLTSRPENVAVGESSG